MSKNKRVLLGMSGGVDSSVAAIILKNQGYEVIGITMNLLDSEINGTCCNITSTLDAKRVCNYLGFPHYTLNFKSLFKEHVIDNFLNEYMNCRTPNPCIECNKYLKFGAMYKKALELDCSYIATGHYAKIEYDHRYNMKVLKKANALEKDQSYVLYNLPQDMLDKLLLPLGNFSSKSEIREIAKKHNLPVSTKPDSQDICFIPDGNYANFIENNLHLPHKKGNIISKEGTILGTHLGLHRYTIGQKRGLKISSNSRLYVTGFNKDKNELIVGDENELYKKEFMVSDINFLTCKKLDAPLKVDIKTRYSSKANPGIISQSGNIIKVVFDEGQKNISPGQSAVFYDGDIVIGGGKII